MTARLKAGLVVLAFAGLASSATAEFTCVETFSDAQLGCSWVEVGDFGGQPGSVVVEGGLAAFVKTGDDGGYTRAIGLSAGGVDNRLPAPWTAEVTLPDTSDFPENGGYLVLRFWAPGVGVYDWLRFGRTGDALILRDAEGEPLVKLDASTVNAARIRVAVATSGVTVSVVEASQTFDAGTHLSWTSPVTSTTPIGLYLAAMDVVGDVVPGAFRITIDDLTLITDDPIEDGGGPPGDAPRFQPRLAATDATNLIPNSSFEAGIDTWLSLGKPTGWGGNVAGLYGKVVDGEGWHGTRALRIPAGADIAPVSHFDVWPPATVVQDRLLAANRGWFPVESNASYTLSAYMRADTPGSSGVLQVVFSGDARLGTESLVHEVTLGTEWERYSFPLIVPGTANSAYVAVGPARSAGNGTETACWVDAVQFESGGEASAYAPRETMEVGFDTGAYGNVLDVGTDAETTVSVRNDSDTAASLTISLEITDYWDETALEGDYAIQVPPHTTTETVVPLALPPGFYQAHWTWETGGSHHARTIRLALVEPYGFDDSPFGFNHGPSTREALAQMKKAGITWVRDWSANWQWAEETEGTYSFDVIDPQILRLTDDSVNVLGLLPSNPSTNWSSEASGDVAAERWHRLAYAPQDPEKLNAFIAAGASRYRDHVVYWEFLNEPLWSPDFCLPGSQGYGVADYISLLAGASAAMRSANPNAIVLGGLSIQSEMTLGDQFIRAGGLDYVDIYNLHPYPGRRTPESFLPDMERIARVMDENGGRKPIWATETGYYGTDELPFLPWSPPPGHWSANLLLDSEETAANYFTRFSTILLARGVEKIFWHEPTAGDVNNGLPDLENGFVASGGYPRKAYAALSGLANVLGPHPRYAYDWVIPATVAGFTTGEVYGYVFEGEGNVVLIAWTDGQGENPDGWAVVLSDDRRARSVVGSSLAYNDATLSASPIYVVSASLTPEEMAQTELVLPADLPVRAEDVNQDGDVDAVDIQLTINGALGLTTGSAVTDVNGDGQTNAIDIQRVVNAALGL